MVSIVVRHSLVVAIVVCLLSGVGRAAFSCLSDGTGKTAVDWWVIYKLPALGSDGNPDVQKGFGYAYMDSTTPTLKLVSGKTLDTNRNGALWKTLDQIYSASTAGYVMWNDETPDSRQSGNRGHTKGVLGFNANGSGGFLLRHSVPRFPAYKKDGYNGFPDYARIYGQTMICVTLDIQTVSAIAYQYVVNAAFVYDSYVPSTIAGHYPNITSLAAGGMNNVIKSSTLVYKTPGGNIFIDFAKTKQCNCELYEDVVAPYFRSDMKALTWGRPLMSTYCRPQHAFNVWNVQNLSWGGSIQYKETKEHSKWAVTAGNNIEPIVCIGDINRMESQALRGGGTTCLSNLSLWKAMTGLINGIEGCPTQNPLLSMSSLNESRQDSDDASTAEAT